jgi:hypothetical protein
VSDFVPLKAYDDGMQGWINSARERVLWQESQPRPIYSEPNSMGSGDGKRALLWQYVRKLDPLAFTEVQTVGDCVAHGSRNARDCTRAVQVLLEQRPESFILRGATEPTYGARGHSGEGMVPARASTFERDVGFLIRKKYDPVDLSKYNGSLGAKWGSTGVPSDVADLCRQQKVGIIRQITTVRDAMDALANGYGIHSGQYAKWAGSPNAQNIHPRQAGGWNHDMATVGFDDTKEFWPFTVFFTQNSWGGWNQPVKDWPASYPEQVPGMIVTKADDWAVCVTDGDAWAYGNVDGFPPQKLPDYGAVGLLQT